MNNDCQIACGRRVTVFTKGIRYSFTWTYGTADRFQSHPGIMVFWWPFRQICTRWTKCPHDKSIVVRPIILLALDTTMWQFHVYKHALECRRRDPNQNQQPITENYNKQLMVCTASWAQNVNNIEMPRTLMTPSLLIRRFCGFKSLCNIRRWWQNSKAADIW